MVPVSTLFRMHERDPCLRSVHPTPYRRAKKARLRALCPRVETLEGRQLLTVSFSDGFSPSVIVSEHVPYAAINLSSDDSASNVTENVRLTTSDGTAKAGIDYTAIDQVVTFGQGETHKTIALPILNDGKPDGNETVDLTLDKISSTRGTRYPHTWSSPSSTAKT